MMCMRTCFIWSKGTYIFSFLKLPYSRSTSLCVACPIGFGSADGTRATPRSRLGYFSTDRSLVESRAIRSAPSKIRVIDFPRIRGRHVRSTAVCFFLTTEACNIRDLSGIHR